MYNKLSLEQEQRIIKICELMLQQKINEMTCICDDNLNYSIGSYEEYFAIRVKKQVQEGIAFIDYCDFYKLSCDDFELEYLNSTNDFS